MFFLETFLIILFIYVFMRPIYLGYFYSRPPRLQISVFTPDGFGVPYNDVALTANDGIELHGWYMHSQNGAAVILLHGHSGNRLAVRQQAEALIGDGFGVLMMDLRAHGQSGGKQFGRSDLLVGDLLTAVAYLSKRPDVNAAGLGVYGVSVGGMIALHAAAKTVAIRAIVTDGASPADATDLPPVNSFLERVLGFPMQRLFMRASQRFANQPPLPSNTAVLPQLHPRPQLFISTGNGAEQRMVKQFADTAGEQAVLWELVDAHHASGWVSHPEVYAEKLIHFFSHALRADHDFELDTKIEATPLPMEEDEAADHEIASDATISMFWANFVALGFLPLAYLLFFLPYRWLWGTGVMDRELSLTILDIVVGLLALFAGIVLHEWLHGIGYVRVGGLPKTAVRYGFSWKMLAPYAHAKAPMRASAYRVAVLMPGLLLGVLPGIIGVVANVWWLVLWATMMLIAAGGDTAVIIAIRHVPANNWVLDHPQKVGCQVLKGNPLTENKP
ncbi:MAG: alpha/beta fold hydrolase [Chloroflexi bacterium]|nr:alpha/beta fold hydrolase [Chloroflexota bacterium]